MQQQICRIAVFFRQISHLAEPPRPIAGAKIQIRNINDANDIIEETETNSAGKSDLITLPAPPLEYSMMPGTERPYSTYSIQITAPNFEPVEISGAEILSGQTALQNTTLIPKPNTPEANEELFVIPPHTLYEKYPPKIPEEEIKTVEETGEIVLSRVVIPLVFEQHAIFLWFQTPRTIAPDHLSVV